MSSAVLSAWQARLAMARNSFRRAWSQSALRVSSLLLVTLVLAIGAFVLFRAALVYLYDVEVIGPLVAARLLSLFFFMLFVMLTISNVIVAFQSLYRSREAAFWTLAPLRAERVFDARSLEIALIASWAFLVLGGPLLVAWGLGTGALWPYYVVMPVVLVLFCAIAHHFGTLALIAAVRVFPGLDWKRLVAVVIALLVPIAWAVVRAFCVAPATEEAEATALLVQALAGLGRTEYPMQPGWWAAQALRAAAAGDLRRTLSFGWVLLSTALFFGLGCRAVAGAWLVHGYQLLRGAALQQVRILKRRSTSRPARGPLRALASKDLVLFLRDPAQWSQVVLVAVLASAYVLNLRSLPDLKRFALWGSVASYLNAGVLLLLLGTLTTRFAFPLLSLEGRRAWIVLLAPLERGALVRQKLLLVLPLSLAFGIAAAAVSTHVLDVSWRVRAVTFIAVGAGAFALSGLGVGLGALFPNFREDNPARVVSGFGGTLNFLLALLYSAFVTIMLGAPSLLQALGRIQLADRVRWEPRMLALVLLLSGLVGLVPLLLGRRRLAQLEF